jgi:hypothetical protein
VLAYDATGVIGPEGLATLDSDQIRDLYGRLYEIANPLDPDLQKAWFSTAMEAIQLALELARLAGANSMNGALPQAGAAPAKSTGVSTRSRSSSSGKGRRNDGPTSARLA